MPAKICPRICPRCVISRKYRTRICPQTPDGFRGFLASLDQLKLFFFVQPRLSQRFGVEEAQARPWRRNLLLRRRLPRAAASSVDLCMRAAQDAHTAFAFSAMPAMLLTRCCDATLEAGRNWNLSHRKVKRPFFNDFKKRKKQVRICHGELSGPN